MTLPKNTDNIDGCMEVMEVFFSNPYNRLVMAMFGVYDGEMIIKEALEFAKKDNKKEEQDSGCACSIDDSYYNCYGA